MLWSNRSPDWTLMNCANFAKTSDCVVVLSYKCKNSGTNSVVVTIGVDLAGLLGGRMASAEGGSVPSGVGYVEGCPLSSRLRGLGSVVSSPAWSGTEPRPKMDFGVF